MWKNIIKNGLEKAEFSKDLCTVVIGEYHFRVQSVYVFCWPFAELSLFVNKNFANLSLFSGITRPEQELLTKYLLQKLLGKNVPYTEPVFVNVYGAQESISPAYVAWRASTTNRAVAPARQAGNRFLGFLKGLQIRALSIQATKERIRIGVRAESM